MGGVAFGIWPWWKFAYERGWTTVRSDRARIAAGRSEIFLGWFFGPNASIQVRVVDG
jgi:hypothetical protein